jgi:hypothetical protein
MWEARQKHSKSFWIYEYFNTADPAFSQNKSGSNASVVVNKPDLFWKMKGLFC